MRRFIRRVGGGEFPSGTVMPFYQASAPPGWVIKTTPDDCVLTVDDENGGTTGGSGDITSGSATTGNESSHTHSFSGTAAQSGSIESVQPGAAQASANEHTHSVSGTTGAGSAHSHTFTVAWAKCILAEKA